MLGVIANKDNCIVCVCVRATMCVTVARMLLTHVNVKIHFMVRYRAPLKLHAFQYPNFSITS